MDVAREVAQGRTPERQVLDRPLDARDPDDVALVVLVLDQDQDAVEVVPDEALRAEADRDPDDAEAGDRRARCRCRAGPGSSAPAMTTMKQLDEVGSRARPGCSSAADLALAEVAGRSLARLAVDQGLEHAVHEMVARRRSASSATMTISRIWRTTASRLGQADRAEVGHDGQGIPPLVAGVAAHYRGTCHAGDIGGVRSTARRHIVVR